MRRKSSGVWEACEARKRTRSSRARYFLIFSSSRSFCSSVRTRVDRAMPCCDMLGVVRGQIRGGERGDVLLCPSHSAMLG